MRKINYVHTEVKLGELEVKVGNVRGVPADCHESMVESWGVGDEILPIRCRDGDILGYVLHKHSTDKHLDFVVVFLRKERLDER